MESVSLMASRCVGEGRRGLAVGRGMKTGARRRQQVEPQAATRLHRAKRIVCPGACVAMTTASWSSQRHQTVYQSVAGYPCRSSPDYVAPSRWIPVHSAGDVIRADICTCTYPGGRPLHRPTHLILASAGQVDLSQQLRRQSLSLKRFPR